MVPTTNYVLSSFIIHWHTLTLPLPNKSSLSSVLYYHSGIMFLNIIKAMIRICFYLILIGVCVTSWIKLLKEPTAFEEKIVSNQARLPSFTLCPAQPDGTISNKSIESFEDIEKAIENVKNKYTIEYVEQKPYEQTKMVEKKYTDTLYGVWNFAPKISLTPPFEAVICLIWKPSIEYKLKPDWSYKVSGGII